MTNTYMTAEEHAVLPKLLQAVTQIPEEWQRTLLGYAQAIVDMKRMPEKK